MKKKSFLTLFILLYSWHAFSQDGSDYITSGLDAYARSDWSAAVFSFQKALDNSGGYNEEAAYWLIMANASAKNYKEALEGIDLFLTRYAASKRKPEIIYQQGRIYCLQSEYEKSINTLYGFLRSYSDSKLVPSAYYWIGENLYRAGRLKEARNIFSGIITDYPSSAKVEPSRYKIALIDQGAAHEELLKLLKISHEELLKLSEEYEKSKKLYEQTVFSYQKQIADINRDTRMAELAERLQIEKRKNEELHEKLALLELQNRELGDAAKAAAAKQAELEAKAAEERAAARHKEALKTLKERARRLEDMYNTKKGGKQ